MPKVVHRRCCFPTRLILSYRCASTWNHLFYFLISQYAPVMFTRLSFVNISNYSFVIMLCAILVRVSTGPVPFGNWSGCVHSRSMSSS